MTWLIILYVTVLVVSLFFYLRALFRWFRIKWYFQNTLPNCENECIKVFPRYPLFYYKMRPSPWNKRIAEGVVRRNEILMKYDKENAEQLIHADQELFWSWSAGAIATGIFAFLCVMMK